MLIPAILPNLILITAATATAIVEPQNATFAVQTPLRIGVGKNQDKTCLPTWNRCDSLDLCCPSGTSCGYNNIAPEEERVIVCCPHNTICYSLDNPEMAFVHTSFGTRSTRRQRTGWIAAAVAMAYGVGNWRRRDW